MEMHPAKRVEIIIEAPLLVRLQRALDDAGVTGYTVLPVFGGAGSSGSWTREGQIGGGEGMAAIVSIVADDRVATVLDAVAPFVRRQIGVISVSDCTVLRPERF